MDKLLELEEKLRKAREELEKNAAMGYGNDPSTGMPSGTAGGVNSAVNKKEHDDEKEDKKLIEEKMDEHNEEKHGEAKDEDSAKKSDIEKGDVIDMKTRKVISSDSTSPKKDSQPAKSDKPQFRPGHIMNDTVMGNIKARIDKEKASKSESEVFKFDNNQQWSLEKGKKAGGPGRSMVRTATQKKQEAAQAIRQPAKVTEGGKTTIESPEDQIKAKKVVKDVKVANSKAKAEAAAKERRAKMREEGLLKGEDHIVKFDDNGQWSLEKASVSPRPSGKYDVEPKEVYDGDDRFREVGHESVDGGKTKTIKAADKEKKDLANI